MSVVVVLALGTAVAAAQADDHDRKGGKQSKDAPPVNAPRFASPGRPPGPVMHGPGPHMGDWLRRNETLPADQQLQKLEQNPDFQRLPADRQQRLRDRLLKFNSLPPEQKDRILQRMEVYEHLPPDQQQRVHEMFHQFRALPPDRRQELNRAFLQLQGLSPDARQKMLDSPQYRNNFSEQERGLLRGMSTIGIAPPQHQPDAPTPPPPQQ